MKQLNLTNAMAAAAAIALISAPALAQKAAGKVTAVEDQGKTVVIDGKTKVVLGDAKVTIKNAPGKAGDIVAGMTCDVDDQKKPTMITCK